MWTENALPPGYADLDDDDGARGVFEEGPSGITAGALSPGEVCVLFIRTSGYVSFESRCVILFQRNTDYFSKKYGLSTPFGYKYWVYGKPNDCRLFFRHI